MVSGVVSSVVVGGTRVEEVGRERWEVRGSRSGKIETREQHRHASRLLMSSAGGSPHESLIISSMESSV